MTLVIEGSHQVIEAKQMRQNWIVREDKFCGVSFFHPFDTWQKHSNSSGRGKFRFLFLFKHVFPLFLVV